MAKAEKKSPKEASKTFHDIMKASVKPKKQMATIEIKDKNGIQNTFSYSFTKTSDGKNEDRYLNFEVTHNNEDITIRKRFTFLHDSLNNQTSVEEGGIDGQESEIATKILEKEGF